MKIQIKQLISSKTSLTFRQQYGKGLKILTP